MGQRTRVSEVTVDKRQVDVEVCAGRLSTVIGKLDWSLWITKSISSGEVQTRAGRYFDCGQNNAQSTESRHHVTYTEKFASYRHARTISAHSF